MNNKPLNGLRYTLECNLIDVYNLIETYYSPEYKQFRAWDMW